MDLRITDGPNKYDLMLALFDRHYEPRPVTFSCEHEVTKPNPQFGKLTKVVTLHITQVGIEDGSGQSWLIEGQDCDGRHYSGWYRTDTRQGRLTVQ